MPDIVLNVIHLGNIADLDPVDGNATAENQNALLGTYYGTSDPAAGHIFDLTVTDADGDFLTQSNDTAGTETVTYDLGAGPVVTHYDALLNVDMTVEFGPETGAADYNGLGGVIQTETGDLFLVMIDDDFGLGANTLDDFPISSVTINSISAFGHTQNASASDGQSFVPCFSAQTLIHTSRGQRPVGKIRPGDMVDTLDNGFQPVTWVGHNRLGPNAIARNPSARPVHIAVGAFGGGRPERDLVLSPHHRVLLRSEIAQRMFGEAEVLVPCGRAVGLPGIQRVAARLGIHYVHVLCADHQLIWAEGAACESLFLGPQALMAIRQPVTEGRDLSLPEPRQAKMAPARKLIAPTPRLSRLIKRHKMNRKPLLAL
jgi:hypothetical protein